jgi:hypothetical protein
MTFKAWRVFSSIASTEEAEIAGHDRVKIVNESVAPVTLTMACAAAAGARLRGLLEMVGGRAPSPTREETAP